MKRGEEIGSERLSIEREEKKTFFLLMHVFFKGLAKGQSRLYLLML